MYLNTFAILDAAPAYGIAIADAIVVRIRRPGEPPLHVDRQSGAALSRVIVTSVDAGGRSITVTTRDGRVLTLRTGERTDVSTLKRGDQIDVMYAKASVARLSPDW